MSEIDLRTLSVSQVCGRTGFSRARVHRLCAKGKFKFVREGRGARRILEASVERYFAEQTDTFIEPAITPSRQATRAAADASVSTVDNPFL